MSKKARKNLLNALFLVALIVATIWMVFRDQDLGEIVNIITNIAPTFLVAGFVMVITYVCSESIIIKYLLATVHIKARLLNCVRYSFVGFFYSCITPSATGGQPMQIFYMKRQNIDIPTATIILMLVTIEYKFVLVFIGLAVAIFGQGLVQSLSADVQFFLYLGIALNVFCVSFMSLLVFLPGTAKFLIMKGFALLKKCHLMKEKNNRTERLDASMETYRGASKFLKENKLVIFNTTIISFIQRFFLFAITYLVYRSFGLSTETFFTITILQAIISISVDMLPLPGGMGISEGLYLRIFAPIFGTASLTTASMLVSRGFSYYVLVIVSGIVSFITHLTVTGTKKKGQGQ